MFVKLLLMIFLVLKFSNVYSQSNIISLNECTFLLEEWEEDNGLPPDRFLPFNNTPPNSYDCPLYDDTGGTYPNSGGWEKTVRETLYRNRVIPCNHNGGAQMGCRARQICNYTESPEMCRDMVASREAVTGAILFDSGVNRSGCLVNSSGLNLQTADVNDIDFDPSADGINEHCREVMRLYQLQAGRTGAGGTTSDFNLPTNTSGP